MPVLHRQPGIPLAYELLPGDGPVVVFLPGFASDMAGSKAIHLRDACAAAGQAMLRLDYSGHGESGGSFIDGCIGDWAEDAAFIIREVLAGKKLILVGSSMGGWIALLLALRLGDAVEALLLIAPAPDFTEALIRPRLSDAQRQELETSGLIRQPSEYGPPTPITRKLLEDGAEHLLLDQRIGITCPVHVLHGMADPDVPWSRSLTLAEALDSQNVRLIFIKDGDHRLSRPEDLTLLRETLFALLGQDRA